MHLESEIEFNFSIRAYFVNAKKELRKRALNRQEMECTFSSKNLPSGSLPFLTCLIHTLVSLIAAIFHLY